MSKIQITILIVLLATASIMGVLAYQKYQTNQVTYTFDGPVQDIEEGNKFSVNSIFPNADGKTTQSKLIYVEVGSKTEIINSSRTPSVKASVTDIKGSIGNLSASRVKIFTKENPQTDDNIKAFRVEIIRDFIPLPSK